MLDAFASCAPLAWDGQDDWVVFTMSFVCGSKLGFWPHLNPFENTTGKRGSISRMLRATLALPTTLGLNVFQKGQFHAVAKTRLFSGWIQNYWF